MTKDEIKDRYSMRDIMEKYGLRPNRSGFVPCPFHKEKTASMRVYKDSYYCFGCGESGDIFSFIMGMDNLTFKESFLSLGGTYEEETFQDRLSRYHAMKEQEMKQKQRKALDVRRKLNNDLIGIYREWVGRSAPFTQTWTDCYNALQYQLYIQEQLNELR